MSARAWCLDLTRLSARAGHGAMTGIDRVEYAYLEHLISRSEPVFGLVRTGIGYLLLDRGGLVRFRAALSEDRWRRAGLAARLLRRGDPARAATEATLRRLAMARCVHRRLPALAQRRLPAGTVLLDVGHGRLWPVEIAAIRAVSGGRLFYFVHDTIPLDHPEWQRPDTSARFAASLARAGEAADLLLVNSRQTERDVTRHLDNFAATPEIRVAPIGVAPADPEGIALPERIDRNRPYFAVIGTIEPRKGHGFLLDLWVRLGERGPPPQLVLVGRRGWADPALLRRLDALAGSREVIELGALPDAEAAAVIASARALLMPSRAEGFGLPVAEAVALGTPVVCADLAVYRETVGDLPCYLGPDDTEGWLAAITDLAAGRPRRKERIALPTWTEHFNTALSHG